MNKYFHGIIPPVSIIFDQNGELDRQGTAKVIDYLIEEKVDGLFFLGSGGEFSQLSTEQRIEVAEFTTKYVSKRVPVLIGTGSSSTNETILLSKHAEEIGADGIVVINPYFWSLTEENLLKHFGDIAESVKLPILLYNFPNLTGQDLSPSLVLKLVERHENIVGIKETIDSIEHIHSMITIVKTKFPSFTVFAGFDNHLFNTLSLGGDGAICASINFAPQVALGLYDAFMKNDLELAVKLNKQISTFPKLYKLDSPFIGVVKEAMNMIGLNISTNVLPPARVLNDEKKDALNEILKEAGII
ncbi:dihydrodipicolinate synthase family protein [Sutcliffiella sp. NPDC057660]|uniref:dihydrodipicolinate synthase family protein n=1 Tax=Sutcliffiella sp. NPDC057660 TaxID=3346199 RepID=UPI0036B371F7